MWNVLHFFNIPIHVQEVRSKLSFGTAVKHKQASQSCLFWESISWQKEATLQLDDCCVSVQVCVFTAPLFSAFCALTTYFLAKEVRNQGAGLFAALFAASVPSYISRSVAGSYDNEGVAIFALVLVFFLYVKV